MAADKDRPNNRLEAITSLLILRLNQAFMDKQFESLPDIWRDFAAVLDDAQGLGEFDIDRLAKMIEIGGNVAGNDPAYNALIEKLADFVSARTGEAEGALILLKRAQKLDFSDNFEMIRLLGKAAAGLSKKEYSEAVQLLMLAYRSAGLLWAARASCVFVAATIAIGGEEDSLIPAGIIPVFKIWAWIALEMRHLPDALHAIQLLNGALEVLPLTDESKSRVRDDLAEFDMALGSVFLSVDDDDLRKLEYVPDILEGLGLFTARSALLYTLGHADVLRADGSLPSNESDEDVNRMFSILASRPVAEETRGLLILNAEVAQKFSTSILGMTVEIQLEGSDQSIIVAETVLGSLEAFFSTTIEQPVMPHTELLRISLVERADVSEPAFAIDQMEMKATLTWPIGISPASFNHQAEVQKFLAVVSGQVLVATCVLSDPKKLLDKLFKNEAVHQRMNLITVATNSYHRVNSRNLTRLSDWRDLARESYILRFPRPKLNRFDSNSKNLTESNDGEENNIAEEGKSHAQMNIRSVIDVHAWDKARWKGAAYADMGPACPPAMAFLFENEDGGVKIFERWRERFGERDTEEEIYLALIRQLPGKNPHHYVAIVTSKPPDQSKLARGRGLAVTTRSLTMEPNDSVNLDRFLTGYHRHGEFLLIPAILRSNGPPELLFKLAVIKRSLTVKLAAYVEDGDLESIALRRPANA